MNKFYVLQTEEGVIFGKKWAYGETVMPTNRGDCEYCPICGGVVSLMKWLPPHQITLSSSDPKKWGDFLTGAGLQILVSNRFKEIFENEGLTGISMFYPPVKIFKLGTKKINSISTATPIYHLIEVPYWGANQDDEASEVVRNDSGKVYCKYCRMSIGKEKQEKIVIEDGSWNGTDIFRIRGGPVHFIVSEKFKQVADAHKLNNFWLIPIENYAFNRSRIIKQWFVKD